MQSCWTSTQRPQRPKPMGQSLSPGGPVSRGDSVLGLRELRSPPAPSAAPAAAGAARPAGGAARRHRPALPERFGCVRLGCAGLGCVQLGSLQGVAHRQFVVRRESYLVAIRGGSVILWTDWHRCPGAFPFCRSSEHDPALAGLGANSGKVVSGPGVQLWPPSFCLSSLCHVSRRTPASKISTSEVT